MLFNGNDDMARDADLGDTLNITLDGVSDDVFDHPEKPVQIFR